MWRRKRRMRDFSAEVEEHIQLESERLREQGLSEEEARAAARRAFGNVMHAEERFYEAHRWMWWDDLVQDVRFAGRVLRKNLGFSAVCIITLAIGIGANTAVFTVVNGVLLRPMPFPEPDRVFLVSLAARFGPFDWQPGVSDRDYLAFRDQDRVFEQTATFTRGGTANLTGAGDPVQIAVAYVTTDFFGILRANPAIGRSFLKGEDQPGRDNVAVLSNELWRERFDSDPHILGKPIRLDGVARTVIGIMPAGFAVPEVKVWMPLAVQTGHNSFIRPVVGRLKPGVSPQQAQAALQTFADTLPLGPGENKNDRWPQVIPLKDLFVANIRLSLLVFAGAVAFVLLIACVNVANLFLARAAGRGHEIAVRSTVGANRWRLMRQLLTESTLLSLAGGTAGILLAFWGVPALTALAPAGTIPRMEMIRIDGWVLAFTFGLSILTGILFGLAPAFQATREHTHESLTSAGRTVTRSHEGIRGALTICEIAFALILVTGAGLLLKSFLRLRSVNPGFSTHSVITLTVDLPDTTYRTAAQMQAFDTRALTELSRLPGVVAGGLVNWVPLDSPLVRGDFQVQGGVRPKDFIVDKPCVSPDYFRVMGIRLLRGREFSDHDRAGAPGVVMVSQSVAQTLWPGQDPIGKRISMEDEPKPGDWLVIVGVVDDVKQQGLAEKFDAAIYQPYLQISQPFFLKHMTFVVKTALPPESVAAGMRGVLRDVDQDQPVSIVSMDNLLAATTAEPRFQTRLMATFGAIALVLTIVGVYGVLAYSAGQRTQEIGVRMALGAQRADVLRMLMRQALVLILLGIVLGAVGALSLTHVLARFLFEVKPSDPATFAAVALVLMFSALAACYAPVRNATRVDPLVALRYE
jgi:putative ABC transport system permease protein